MEYRFSMPYFKLLQPGGLSYSVRVWVDKAAESVRIDFRDGVDKTYFIKSEEYAITPRKHELVCAEYKHGGGPVLARGAAADLGLPAGMLGKQVLPDLSDWVDFGPAEVDGHAAVMWQFKEMAGEKVNTYTFYVAEDGTPLKFHSVGQDYFAGSHYDEYIYEFNSFKAGPVDPKAFDVPSLCKKGAGGAADGADRHAAALRAVAHLPGAHAEHKDEAHYASWSLLHGREHADAAEYRARLSAFAGTKARVLAHNRAAAAGGTAGGAPGHTLALNRFADWRREEFDRVMLPKKWKRERGLLKPQVRPPPLATFTASVDRSDLPERLDWRATPADFAVKDQGQCGSCWAFAAVGTLEASWFVQTGSPRSFSEQQLVDCAWDEGPNGCDGGDYQPGFRYVTKAGGIAATQDYPYVGQNDWCKDNSTALTGHFSGYVEVASKDEVAVMEALMRHGPLAVGVDASADDFLFYSEGVYRNKRCSVKPSQLDHAVILVGWGTDARSGEDYWVVKNSWSKLWGDDGYIKIHRGGNDCGIASDAAFAAVDRAHVVPGAAERALALALRASSALAAAA
ncbi:cfaD [Scenedesmus sp. PABB004]|nr:cfaD [Scenedesmus sp. PABB004]